MKTSYSVTWHDPDGEAHVGRLELGAKALRLTEDGDRGASFATTSFRV
jgi:hypothetical protein